MTTYEAGEHSSEKAGLPPGAIRHIGRKGDAAPRVTIIATIFIPLSFFAGVHGMNFTNMPE